MLELKGITKDYLTGGETVHALKGIDLQFRKSEFVSILGQSGCGKTTMLNIIGGLDQYTDGDLIINGRSTKDFKDRDWDAYRNHSIGFVFQTYNLIPHQTVLQNVELALTLSGVSKLERRERAKKALEQVGLGNQLKKRPSQMSGGQMQRVAIARAIVNDPDIILADEPTGALDTETSLQVMEILKEISKDRLVIMVTHNPELAEKYSTRIIRMLDGLVTDDSMPLDGAEVDAENYEAEIKIKKEKEENKGKKEKKPSMSFGTSFMLSLKNLFTKKGRTILTSFAGSIGIIGIALILAVSQGMTTYINHVQETTLSSYPLTLEATTVDVTALMESFMNAGNGDVTHDKDAVYKDPVIGELVNALSKIEESENDLAAFKVYLEKEMLKEDSKIKDAITGVQYSYALNLSIYTKNQDGKIIKSDTGELMNEMIGEFMLQMATGGKQPDDGGAGASSSPMGSAMMSSMMGLNMWQELLSGNKDANGDRALVNDLLKEQYDVIHGKWPSAKDEIVLVLNENNELDDLTLYALGLLSESEIDAIIDAAVHGETLPTDNKKWSYEEICALRFKTIFPYDCYQEIGDTGVFHDISKNNIMLEKLYNEAMELKVVGIIRPNEEAESTMLTGAIGYTYALTDHIIEEANNSAVVTAQLENPDIDVLTGLPFESNTGKMSDEEKKEAFIAYVNDLDIESKAELFVAIQCLDAIEANLESATEEQMSMFQSKEQLVLMISGMLESEAGMSAEQIAEMFEGMTLDELKAMIRPYVEEQVAAGISAQVAMALANIPNEQKAAGLDAGLANYSDSQFASYYDELTEFSSNTYEETLVKIGCLDLSSPSAINLYASTFENKDLIVDMIADYNNSVDESKKIAYTDYLGLMMSSITTIINAITYVLIAFVSISLVVSSIMIGVITLISVQERTKEIGILRAIGASKKNVSSMFNAETMIIGLASGILGVVVTYLLCLPINLILHKLTGIANLNAILPFGAAVILVVISVLLTLFSGLIPSRSAAKKDPVIALRTE